MVNAWAQARPPLAIENRPDDVPHEVLADPEMRKAMATFKPFVVRVPSKWNDHVEECGFYRDVAAFRAKAQAVHDRLEAEAKAEEAKHLAKAVKEGMKVKDGKVVEAPRRCDKPATLRRKGYNVCRSDAAARRASVSSSTFTFLPFTSFLPW